MSVYDEIKASNIDNIKAPEYLTPNDIANFQKSKENLNEIRRILAKTAVIASLVGLPSSLSERLQGILSQYLEFYKKLQADVSGQSTIDAGNYFRQLHEQIKSYHNQVFEVSSSNYTMATLNAISTYGNELTQGVDQKTTELINTLEDQIGKAKKLTEELDLKAKQFVVSDYARIFEKQERKNRNLSNLWLALAVAIAAFFISGLIYTIKHDWFSITTILKSTTNNLASTKEVFNYPLLISKFLLASFLIFLITFCFKQYSINKHLQVINQHRKNAINSFKLFEASLDKTDGSKNILMLQLAKAIYELTHTGFLSKEGTPNSQFIEWTKMIDGGMKP